MPHILHTSSRSIQKDPLLSLQGHLESLSSVEVGARVGVQETLMRTFGSKPHFWIGVGVFFLLFFPWILMFLFLFGPIYFLFVTAVSSGPVHGDASLRQIIVFCLHPNAFVSPLDFGRVFQDASSFDRGALRSWYGTLKRFYTWVDPQRVTHPFWTHTGAAKRQDPLGQTPWVDLAHDIAERAGKEEVSAFSRSGGLPTPDLESSKVVSEPLDRSMSDLPHVSSISDQVNAFFEQQKTKTASTKK